MKQIVTILILSIAGFSYSQKDLDEMEQILDVELESVLDSLDIYRIFQLDGENKLTEITSKDLFAKNIPINDWMYASYDVNSPLMKQFNGSKVIKRKAYRYDKEGLLLKIQEYLFVKKKQ